MLISEEFLKARSKVGSDITNLEIQDDIIFDIIRRLSFNVKSGSLE